MASGSSTANLPNSYIGRKGGESKPGYSRVKTRGLQLAPSILLRGGERPTEPVRYLDVDFECGDRFAAVHLDLDLVGLE